MNGLLESMITLVGVVLVLALVSQSLIEVVKASFPIKGFTRNGSARSLLEETAKAEGLSAEDGRAVYRAVTRRLEGLGQNGWVGLRLDTLTAQQLDELVQSLDRAAVSELGDCPDFTGTLKRIGERARRWFPLAMEPVSCRYRRRMRATNLVAAAVVVIGFNMDAFAIIDRARTDEGFRETVAREVEDRDALMTRADSIQDAIVAGLAASGDTVAGPPLDSAMLAALGQRLDSLRNRSLELASTGMFDVTSPRRWGDVQWWMGILLSTLLVSLGAPFWHDLLGTVFGLKRRARSGGRPKIVEGADDDNGAGGVGRARRGASDASGDHGGGSEGEI